MAVLPSRSQIRPGTLVDIEMKENQGTGQLTSGPVVQILTSGEYHPHGIKVQLVTGQIGRVKKILGGANTAKSNEFEDLDKIQIPRCEDDRTEFKEYYQYDKKMDVLDDSKESEVIKNLKTAAQKIIATAVCSFGNSRTGGFLYLGIASDGTVTGLETDLKLGKFADYDDSFANDIRERLGKFIDDKVFLIDKLKIRFRKIDGKTICIIQILPAEKPLYLCVGNDELFFLRGSVPRAEKLGSRQQYQYIKERFPNA